MRKHPIPPPLTPELLPVEMPTSSLPMPAGTWEASPFELVPYGPMEGPADEVGAFSPAPAPDLPEEATVQVTKDGPVAPVVDDPPPARDVAGVESQVQDSSINYDDEGLLEVELEEAQYRFDAGKQGTALCLSVRAVGTYRWSSLGELKWDGRDLRSKSLERKLLGRLSLALREFSQAQAD